MRGTRAKTLRRQAAEYVLTVLKKSHGEGYGTYGYEQNKISWTPMLDKDGNQMKDPDGVLLKTVKKVAGTIRCGWKTRVVYKALKNKWKTTHNVSD